MSVGGPPFFGNDMEPSEIESYFVRRRGCVAWRSDIASESEAHAEAQRARQVTGLAHCVFALHADGHISGPYYAPELDYIDMDYHR